MKDKPVFVCLIPDLDGEYGHHYPYNKCVEKAVNRNDWECAVLVPKGCKINNLPIRWKRCLFSDNKRTSSERGKLSKIRRIPVYGIKAIKDLFLFGISVYLFIHKNVSKKKECIIFIESFSLLHLSSLLFVLLFFSSSRNLSILLLYRIDQTLLKFKGKLDLIIINLIISFLKPGALHILTDSELLKAEYSKFFKKKVHVMPIPHTSISDYEETHQKKKNMRDEIICWWPGQPRKSKGLHIMQNLVNFSLPEANQITIIAANSSNLTSTTGGVKVELIENVLTREEYLKWLSMSDLILLPYDSGTYKCATSGIFVEAIVGGRIPVVMPNTWMAYELAKYDLGELIINWDRPKIIIELIEIYNSSIIKNLLHKIGLDYKKYHNVNSYASSMKAIF